MTICASRILAESGKLVVIDETAGLQNAVATPGVVGDSDDNDIAGPFPVSVINPGVPGADSTLFGAPAIAQSVGAVVVVTPNYGAMVPGIAYSIDVPGSSVASGLTTTSGKAITLFEVSPTLVVGRYDADGNGISSSDPAAFAIHIDATTGVMTVIQYVAIKHDDRGDFDEDNDNGNNANDAAPDDPLTAQQWIANGSLRVTATVTDHDGDSVDQRFDIGNAIVFEDDGPSLTVTAPAAINGLDFGNFVPNGNAWGTDSGTATGTNGGWTIADANQGHSGGGNTGPGAVQLERVGDGYLGLHSSTNGFMVDLDASARDVQISQS